MDRVVLCLFPVCSMDFTIFSPANWRQRLRQRSLQATIVVIFSNNFKFFSKVLKCLVCVVWSHSIAQFGWTKPVAAQTEWHWQGKHYYSDCLLESCPLQHGLWWPSIAVDWHSIISQMHWRIVWTSTWTWTCQWTWTWSLPNKQMF